MKLLFKHCHEGTWFSENGHKAYKRGEKPKWMFPDGMKLEPTCTHHIARERRCKGDFDRPLVLFYRAKRVDLSAS